MTRFKFQRQPALARTFALLMLQAQQRMAAPAVDLLLPVPAAPARLRERGYNPAWELARRLAQMLAIPADTRMLQRLHDTPHQVGLNRTQRLLNTVHAFTVPAEQAALLSGRRVAIVDDVLTTGATAEAATRTLLQAGAADVQIWVAARTPASPAGHTPPASNRAGTDDRSQMPAI